MMPSYPRRDFLKLAAAALPAAGLWPAVSSVFAAGSAPRPDSKVAGVQIGLNVPYSFGSGVTDADEILKNCLQLGLSGVELRTQPVEVFLGAPKDLIYPPKKDKNAPKADAAKTDGASNAAKLKEWRKSAPMERVKEFRNKWENAGVLIEIVKVDGIFKMSDEEIDYTFALAKALGGRAISTEISKTEADLKRVGEFADKHQFMVGYHGHAATAPEHWEAAFALAKFNGANLDIGHFVAGNNTSPVPFMKKYHDRITHIHVKDRKFNNGPSVPFGEGDVPIAEILRLVRDSKWNLQATIEFEYKVPADSDRMKELARTIQFCRDALAS